MPLADEFFLLAHNSTGKPRLSLSSLSLGLAAALLAELILERRIALAGSELRVVDDIPPADALAHTVLNQIMTEPSSHPVRSWLDYLGKDARERVGQRLERAGLVRREASRRPWGKSVRYEPTDVNRTAANWARLSTMLRRAEPMHPLDILLSGLALVSGLDGYLLEDGRGPAHRYMLQIVSTLPPQLRELLNQTEAAVGDAVLSYRT
ncbi:MAG TPA: GPP34 family phosphoprotein [Mycobacteriales bacterium]